jgi:alpha-L-fucosidase 2
MKILIKNILILLLCITSISLYAKNDNTSNTDRLNVIWTSPSDDSFGSMPLGNGDVGLNVWVEKSGDLVFYISKVNAFDAGHLLPKLGRVRVKLQPALSVTDFKQTLSLKDASIQIQAGDVQLKVWIDANKPLICVEGNSKTARKATISLETLRPLTNFTDSLKNNGTVGVLFNDKLNRLAWCYRNQTSAWGNNIKIQNSPEMVAKIKDPILHRTSGCSLVGKGFVRSSDNSITSTTKKFDITISVLSSQPENLKTWLSDVSKPAKPDWKAHCAYWNSFWNRSFIHITNAGAGNYNLDQCRYTQFAQGSLAYEGHKLIDAQKNIDQINQKYALERFLEAAANRGEVPAPYNGSIFTMDMPVGVQGAFGPKNKPISPDGRDWAQLSFMWQNTRHPLWSMATRGDFDAIKPGMEFVRNGLEICKDRCRKTFGHDGAFIMEASWWHNVGVWDWKNVPAHLKYHLLASIETVAIMCEYYEHTQDAKFLNETLLPCADEFLKFYELHYPKRNAQGIMQMEGVGCAETFQGVTNPATEMGCLKYVLSKLLTFTIDSQRRNHWQAFLKAMPEVPLRTIRGLNLLAVGENYNPGREICESPELYSIYPFRQVCLGKDSLIQLARQSFSLRTVSIDGTADGQGVETGGWQSAPVQAAYLGLSREAARLASINFNDQFIAWHDNVPKDKPFPNRPRARFPAFWECKMDGTPDNDHGANSVNTLQSMLLQSDGKKIFLLPAWPEEWDVNFKLHAPFNTTVECEYRDGKIQSLKVTPESRRADIVNRATDTQRIRTMVEVALTDYNYLFNLPAILDAQPVAGKATGKWAEKYGYTLEGCKAGPWKNSVFKGNTVYVHTLDWPAEGVKLPAIPRQLINSQSITGDVKITKTADGWLLTGTPDAVNTIVKLEFDRSVEEIALAMPTKGSHTLGLEKVTTKDAQGKTIVDVKFDAPKTVNRFEITIVNPDHFRGNRMPYEIHLQQTDGSWKKVYAGSVFGMICSMKIEKTEAIAARIVTDAKEVSQFDLFK